MIDPIAFHLGPLAIRWYGITYVVGLFLVILILTKLNKKRRVFKGNDQIFDLMFWVFLLGVIAGGRLGYVIFYNLPYFLAHPMEILEIWKGGMSFHGGLIGSFMVGLWYCKKHKIDWLSATDLAAVPAGLALMFGRLANFVNQELVGRVIESAGWQWLGADFGDGMLRWPSQLFAAGKDFLIFLIMLLIFRKNPRRGVLFANFLMLYGMFRFIVEFYRAPDEQVGFIFNYFTLGQIFCLVMTIVGAAIFASLKKTK